MLIEAEQVTQFLTERRIIFVIFNRNMTSAALYM